MRFSFLMDGLHKALECLEHVTSGRDGHEAWHYGGIFQGMCPAKEVPL